MSFPKKKKGKEGAQNINAAVGTRLLNGANNVKVSDEGTLLLSHSVQWSIRHIEAALTLSVAPFNKRIVDCRHL